MANETLVERFRARIESDVPDEEVLATIQAASDTIIERWGPDRDTDSPIVVEVDGGCGSIHVARPIDNSQQVSIREISPAGFVSGEEWVELDAVQFRIRNGGRTISRIADGALVARSLWGSSVEVSYVPVDDQAQRDEIVLELTILALTYRGLIKSEQVGDYRWQSSLTAESYEREREALIGRLNPQKGVGVV